VLPWELNTETVTHSSTNWAQRRLTSLIENNSLSLRELLTIASLTYAADMCDDATSGINWDHVYRTGALMMYAVPQHTWRRHQFDTRMASVWSTHTAPVWHTDYIITHGFHQFVVFLVWRDHLQKVNKLSGVHFQTLFPNIFLFFWFPQYSNRLHHIQHRWPANYFNNHKDHCMTSWNTNKALRCGNT